MNEIIPLFKTHYSIGGKSILTEDDVFRLHEESKQEKLVLVEDSLAGFRKVAHKANEDNTQLIFGLRIDVVQDSLEENKSKLIFFAKNTDGIKSLMKIYTKAFCENGGVAILNDLDELIKENIQVAVPFYDSFLYVNYFYFGACSLDIEKYNPWFFEEDNKHPHDQLIKNVLDNYLKKRDTIRVKSIYYEKREDFKAFQMFKAISNRSGGSTPSFDRPRVEGLGSPEFCFESWKELLG